MKNKIYLLSREERLNFLKENNLINNEEFDYLLSNKILSPNIAVHSIENQIGQISMPLGIATNFFIDNRERTIAMATEEPSVIAAASNAAKIIKKNNGFKTFIHDRLMIGQIVIYKIKNIKSTKKTLYDNFELIKKVAYDAYPSITKYGGGLRDIHIKEIINEESYLSLELHIDVKEAMGANIVNTILEAVANELENKLNEANVLFKILSNYATKSLVSSKCIINPKSLSKDPSKGEIIAKKIVEATKYANLDTYRAVTHNKGIMNGVDAVLLATANDYRAIEAACHAYAAKDGKYKSLSTWKINEDGFLEGELTLPMPIATVGGATGIFPMGSICRNIMQIDKATDLASIIVSVGLAQNFSALKALVTEGIQKGHMSLHLKSLSISVGAKDDEIIELTEILKREKIKNTEVAKNNLEKIRRKNIKS